mmetsp:Transcript_13569/g.26960  ORF Transcript_13569/g.26960 Transcript_13569/m.26960 type:complete len:806 (+) Transcript_13569:168-2585(+)
MEGFLFKKARGESTFGRHNWKLRWFILESTNLSYYEKFDAKGNKPMDVKGIYPTDGCTIKEVQHPEFKNAFMIEHHQRNPLMVAAETENLKNLWMKAIKESSKLSPGEIPGQENPEKYLETLGMPPNRQRSLTKLTDSELESAFKFKSLQADPLHGGDQETFDRVHEAYNMLIQLKKHRIEDKKHILVHFSADIKKGPPGEGFGMVVNVDDRHNIFVKKVLPCIAMSNATHNSQGEVRVGDEILGIDGESTAGWSLARLVQRLNDFRVPVGTTINLMFQRRIKVPEEPKPTFGGGDSSEMLKEPVDEPTSNQEPHISGTTDMLQSQPAENEQIPDEDGVGKTTELEGDSTLESVRKAQREEEDAQRLRSSDENAALKSENARLQSEFAEMKKALDDMKAEKEKAEKELREVIEKTEEYFVSSNRINEAMNGTGVSGDDFQVPEKMELNDVSETERLIELEHRLLKVGLRVEEDPADQVHEQKLSMKGPEMSVSAMDVFDPTGKHHNVPSPSNDGREDKDDGDVDVFEDYHHDSEEEEANNRARVASLSFSLNDPGHKEEKEEKAVKFAMDNTSHAGKDVASVSLMWSYSHKEQLDERKRMEKQYGTLGADKKIKTYAHKSPHVQKTSPTLNIKTKFEKEFGSIEEPTKRLISAKDRIKIQDELDPLKPPKTKPMRSPKRQITSPWGGGSPLSSKTPTVRTGLEATVREEIRPNTSPKHVGGIGIKGRVSMPASRLEELGFRTEIEDPKLLQSIKRNQERYASNQIRYAQQRKHKVGGARSVKAADKGRVHKLLMKRKGAGLASTM